MVPLDIQKQPITHLRSLQTKSAMLSQMVRFVTVQDNQVQVCMMIGGHGLMVTTTTTCI